VCGDSQEVFWRETLIVGVLILHLFIAGSGSLKEKRRHIRSIKDKLRSSFNVSVSEIDNQELWQRATLGVVIAGSDTSSIKKSLDKIREFVNRNWSHLVMEIEQELISL